MKHRIKKFIKWTIDLVKSFWSVRGMISLGISFMLFYGWLLVFIVIGIISGNAWFYGVGIGGVVFWAGPFTPFFPIMLGVATFLRKVVFRDNKSACENKDSECDRVI